MSVDIVDLAQSLTASVAEQWAKSVKRYLKCGSNQHETMPGHWPVELTLTVDQCRRAYAAIAARAEFGHTPPHVPDPPAPAEAADALSTAAAISSDAARPYDHVFKNDVVPDALVARLRAAGTPHLASEPTITGDLQLLLDAAAAIESLQAQLAARELEIAQRRPKAAA